MSHEQISIRFPLTLSVELADDQLDCVCIGDIDITATLSAYEKQRVYAEAVRELKEYYREQNR